MTVINCTPHEINVLNDQGTYNSFPLSGIVARCAQTETHVGYLSDMNVTSQSFGEVENLPPKRKGNIYIVSRLVAEAMKGQRDDLYFPGPLIRDDNGNVIGCQSLCVL